MFGCNYRRYYYGGCSCTAIILVLFILLAIVYSFNTRSVNAVQ